MNSSKRLISYIKNYKSNLATSILLSIIYSFSAAAVYLTIPLLKTLFLSESPVPQTTPEGNFVRDSLKWIEDLVLGNGPNADLLLSAF